MAIDEINNRNDILPHYNLRFAVRSAIGPIQSYESTMYLTRQAFHGTGVIAIIGALPSDETIVTNTILTEDIKMVQISTIARAVELSVKKTNLFKARTVPADSFGGMAYQWVVGVLFKYKKVSIFYSNDNTSFRTRTEVGDGVYAPLEVLSDDTFSIGTDDFTEQINAAKKQGGQVFIILTDPKTSARLIEQGYEMGLFKEGTQIFCGELCTYDTILQYFSDGANVPRLMKGVIGIRYTANYLLSRIPQGMDFVKKFRALPPTVIKNKDGTESCVNTTDTDGNFYLYREQKKSSLGRLKCAGVVYSDFLADGSNTSPGAPHAYDATYLLAHSLHMLLEEEGATEVTGEALHRVMVDNVTFYGATGHVDVYEGMSDLSWYAAGDREEGQVFELVGFSAALYASSGGTRGLASVGVWDIDHESYICDQSTDEDVMLARQCQRHVYNTADNLPARDSPADIIVVMPVAMSNFLIAFGSVCAMMTAAAFIFVVKYRKDDIIKVGQPPMLYFLLAGALLGSGRVIVGGMAITDVSCTVGIWFGHLAFTLAFGSLYIKTWRVSMLLGSTSIKRVTISTRNVVIKMCATVAFVVAFMLFLTFFCAPHKRELSVYAFNQVTTRSMCDMNHRAVHTTMFAVEGVLLFVGTRLCWSIKSLPSSFNESKDIAGVITVILLVSLLVFPIVFLLDMEQYLKQLISAMGFGVCLCCLLGLFFGSKMLMIVQESKDPEVIARLKAKYDASSASAMATSVAEVDGAARGSLISRFSITLTAKGHTSRNSSMEGKPLSRSNSVAGNVNLNRAKSGVFAVNDVVKKVSVINVVPKK